MILRNRKTIQTEFSFSGIGVHSGKDTTVTLKPAHAREGLMIHNGQTSFKAQWGAIIDSRSATTLGDGSFRVGMVEHLLAACYGLGITDLHIHVKGTEMPIFDGSARVYAQALKQATIVDLGEKAPYLIIKEPFVVQKNTSMVVFLPGNMAWEAHVPLGQTVQVYRFNEDQDFMDEIAGARTFVQYQDIQALQKSGYIQGGSLECALVLEGDRPIKEQSFLLSQECARHKILDMMGDFYLCGAFIQGCVIAYGPSHAFNAYVLRQLLEEEKTCYHWA